MGAMPLASILAHISRFPLGARLAATVLLVAAAAGGASTHLAHRLLAADAAYSRLLAGEAAGALLITRAGINVVEDGRLVLALFAAADAAEHAAIADDRRAALARADALLTSAAAALPHESPRIEAFARQFNRVAAAGDAVGAALAEGDRPRARDLLLRAHKPDHAALRVAMRDLALSVDAGLHAASDRLSADAARTAWLATGLTIGGTVLAVLGAGLALRGWFMRPLHALSHRMNALAYGDAATPVPGLDRRDAFHPIAWALECFRLAELDRARLARASATDQLTGLLNRRGALAALDDCGEGEPLAAIAIDLDHFKSANDRHGHEAGDALLREVAGRIRECVRAGDLVCRMGGDEFVVALPGLSCTRTLEGVAQRLRTALNRPVRWEGRWLNLGATLGVSLGTEPPRQLLRRADEALMDAKRRGARGSVAYAEAVAA